MIHRTCSLSFLCSINFHSFNLERAAASPLGHVVLIFWHRYINQRVWIKTQGKGGARSQAAFSRKVSDSISLGLVNGQVLQSKGWRLSFISLYLVFLLGSKHVEFCCQWLAALLHLDGSVYVLLNCIECLACWQNRVLFLLSKQFQKDCCCGFLLSACFLCETLHPGA